MSFANFDAEPLFRSLNMRPSIVGLSQAQEHELQYIAIL